MRKLTYSILLLVLVLAFNYSYAQISEGGLPPSFINTNIIEEYDEVNISAPNLNQILSEDTDDEKNGTFRKNARLLAVKLDMTNSGVWTELSDGGRIWRLKIKSVGAIALGVYYDRFHLPANGKLFLYNESKTQVIGAFSEFNNPETGDFANELIEGDAVILEYYEPAGTAGFVDISIERIAWVYRDANFDYLNSPDGFGDSDYCQVNVNCSPEGDNYQDEKRGVVRIYIIAGSMAGWCSGSMINNVKQDCTPYLLTADHCGDGSSTSNFNQYVFYFNYEANGCSNPLYPPTSNTVTGCSKRSAANANSASDFLLLELNTFVPSSYNTFYNGWDRRNISSPNGVSIHHPAGDIKKISTYNNSLTSSSWGSVPYTHWRVFWNATTNGHGVTEGGSSGSPIFNAEGRVIGDLTGGGSYCNSTGSPDLYGKFSYSWDSYGSGTTTHLKEWLDPDNTGIETLNGKNNVCNENPPTAYFISADTIVPYGQPVNFIDASLNFPHHWTWIFEAAINDTSYQQNPYNVQWDSIGDFDVTIIVWNDYGTDTLVFVDYISVVPVPSDLDIIGNTISPNIIPAGYNITVNSVVKNLGQSTSPQNYLKLYMSDNISWDVSDLLLDSIIVDTLNQLDQITVSKDIIIPVGTPLGVNYIVFYVDADNIIYESNENNNTSFKAVIIVADLPDLEIGSVVVDSLEIHAGQLTAVSCMIESSGFQDSPAGTLEVFLSPDQQFDISSDLSLGTSSFSSIVTGSDENLNLDVTIPLNSQQGDMYILFVADPDDTIEESDEDNNIAFKQINVLQPIGINSIDGNLNVSIIPNPNQGEFVVRITNIEYTEGLIQIIDASGRIVMNDYLSQSGNDIKVDIKDLPKGVYMMNLILDGNYLNRKFIKE